MKQILTIILLCICLHVSAQKPAIQPLKIGDRMPPYKTANLINFGKPEFDVAEYQDRLLVFDFWATWCHWCIEAFPKNDSLQLKFGNRIQIMLVDGKYTDDRKDKIEAFYKARKAADKRFNLPTIYEDVPLKKLFPHDAIPHYVWVYKGEIIAITESSDFNSANIERVLNGEKPKLRVKTD